MLLGLLDIYMHRYGTRTIYQIGLAGSGLGAASGTDLQYVVRLYDNSKSDNG